MGTRKGFGFGSAVMRKAFQKILAEDAHELGIVPPESEGKGNYLKIVKQTEGQRLKKEVKHDLTQSSRSINPIHTKGKWAEDPNIGKVVSEKYYRRMEIMEENVKLALLTDRFEGFDSTTAKRTDFAIVAFMLFEFVALTIPPNERDKYLEGDYYYFPTKTYSDFLASTFPESDRVQPQSMWAAFKGVYIGLEDNPQRNNIGSGLVSLKKTKYSVDIPKEMNFLLLKHLTMKQKSKAMPLKLYEEIMLGLGGGAAEKVQNPPEIIEPTSDEEEISTGTEAMEALDNALDNITELKGKSNTEVAVSAFLNSLPDNKREASFEVTETGWKMKYVL